MLAAGLQLKLLARSLLTLRQAEQSMDLDSSTTPSEYRQSDCLITGAAGVIGSHLTEHLLQKGISVTALDNFDPFYPRFIKESNLASVGRHSGFRFAEIDIRDTSALRGLPGGYDCIIHLAAKAGVRTSIADPDTYHQVNVIGTRNLLECAREWGTRQFVFASSSSVYGVNSTTPWTERDTVLSPVSPYASTKVSGEILGRVYSHMYGIRFLGLRFFSAYGPRQRPDQVIRKLSELILAGRPVPVFGDGSSSRDYTYVDDIVSAIRAAMDYRATNYEVINVGYSRPVALRDIIHTIEDALHKRAVLDFQPEQSGDVPFTCADIQKAQLLLAYQPRTSFQEGIKRFTDWLTSRDTDRPLTHNSPAIRTQSP